MKPGFQSPGSVGVDDMMARCPIESRLYFGKQLLGFFFGLCSPDSAESGLQCQPAAAVMEPSLGGFTGILDG